MAEKYFNGVDVFKSSVTKKTELIGFGQVGPSIATSDCALVDQPLHLTANRQIKPPQGPALRLGFDPHHSQRRVERTPRRAFEAAPLHAVAVCSLAGAQASELASSATCASRPAAFAAVMAAMLKACEPNGAINGDPRPGLATTGLALVLNPSLRSTSMPGMYWPVSVMRNSGNANSTLIRG